MLLRDFPVAAYVTSPHHPAVKQVAGGARAMSGVVTVTRTDYFTYITDGNDEVTFRAKDQVWNVRVAGIDYTIHVAGPNAQPAFAGQYNAFAKKHLLTLAGGKADGQYGTALDQVKSGNSREIKKGQTLFDRTVTGKLSKIHGQRQHGDMYDYYRARQDRHDELEASSQAQYQVKALGGRTQDQTVPLTMVLCDLVAPEELKAAFATAIAVERKRTGAMAGVAMTGANNHGVPVLFDVDCVFQHDDVRNTFKRGDCIKVTIYLERCTPDSVVAHVVHCHGT